MLHCRVIKYNRSSGVLPNAKSRFLLPLYIIWIKLTHLIGLSGLSTIYPATTNVVWGYQDVQSHSRWTKKINVIQKSCKEVQWKLFHDKICIEQNTWFLTWRSKTNKLTCTIWSLQQYIEQCDEGGIFQPIAIKSHYLSDFNVISTFLGFVQI